jgi:hypothetical protein
MDINKTWKEKRLHFIHEINSGVLLVIGNLRLIEDGFELFKEGLETREEFETLVSNCIRRSKAGVQKIKDSQDYIYNQIKDLK